MSSSNTRGVIVLSLFMLGAALSVVAYGPVLYGDTVGTLPSDERSDEELRFEALSEMPDGGADLTESDLTDDATIEEVDRAIDQNTTAFGGPSENIPNGTFTEGQIYRHGDTYYEVQFVTTSQGYYPPAGYLAVPTIALSLMTLSVMFSLFALVLTPFYMIGVLVFAQNWHRTAKDYVWYTLVIANVLTAGTAGLIIL